MTSLPERQQLVERFNHAVASGARKAIACAEIGLSLRSLQRWALTPVIQADVRTTTLRPRPSNSLSAEERRTILDVCNSPPFTSLPPSQIVPRLADQGRYLASEATFYRVLNAKGRALARPSERSERFEPFVRPRHGVTPATKRDCSTLLDCGLEHTRTGLQVEELEDAGRRERTGLLKM